MPKKSIPITQTGEVDGRISNVPPKSMGRPKGAKNKTTLFKEVMREGFEEKLQEDFHKVLDAVVTKAIDGDMSAAKLLMDRVVPVSKAIDLEELEKTKGLTISINVGQLDTPEPLEGTAEVIDAN